MKPAGQACAHHADPSSLVLSPWLLSAQVHGHVAQMGRHGAKLVKALLCMQDCCAGLEAASLLGDLVPRVLCCEQAHGCLRG